jgi:TonB family protein
MVEPATRAARDRGGHGGWRPRRRLAGVALGAALALALTGTAIAEMLVDVRAPADAPRWYVFEVGRRIQDGLVTATVPAGSAVLEVHSDGRISELFLSRSSGDVASDEIVLRAIRDAAPLPALPPDYGQPTIQLSVSWRPPR